MEIKEIAAFQSSISKINFNTLELNYNLTSNTTLLDMQYEENMNIANYFSAVLQCHQDVKGGYKYESNKMKKINTFMNRM